MDTKTEYWDKEFDEESNLLCTFNTPLGRYEFNNLPSWSTVSQDMLQKKLDYKYQDIENVCGIADDIIIAGKTPQEHEAMVKMLKASTKITSVLIPKNYSSSSRKVISTATDCRKNGI